MYILMISRGFPSNYHPQWGCFEKDQAEALAKLGHKVIVMSVDARFISHKGSLGIHHFNANGVEYYNKVVIPGNIISRLIGKERYWRIIKTKYYTGLFNKILKTHGKPDIIYSQFFMNTAFAVYLKNQYKIPLVGIEHLGRFNLPNLPSFDERWARRAFEGCDTLIAVAGTLAKNIEDRFSVQCEVVHNMHGFEFNPDMSVLKSACAKEPIIFVSTASLFYMKGFDALINAFDLAKLPCTKWRLRIIGDGEERVNLQNLISKKGLENNISLLGRMTKAEIVTELKTSHVFVLPSRNENFSVAILEGLAMGLPVLATDCGGIRECLTEKNGVIVPVDDVQAMADAIKDFVNNYSKYDRKAIAQDCKERFSPEAIALKLTSVFQKTIDSKRVKMTYRMKE